MNLQSMLPFLEGWRFELQEPISFSIPAGQFNQTFHSATIKKPMSGYILGISACADNPLAQLEMLHFGPRAQERLVTGSPFTLNAIGAQYPNGSGLWFGTYSAVAGLYCAFYNPDSRIGFWNSEMRLRVLNPTAGTINISTYHHTLVLILDENEWRNSIRKFYQSNIFHVKGLKEVKLNE